MQNFSGQLDNRKRIEQLIEQRRQHPKTLTMIEPQTLALVDAEGSYYASNPRDGSEFQRIKQIKLQLHSLEQVPTSAGVSYNKKSLAAFGKSGGQVTGGGGMIAAIRPSKKQIITTGVSNSVQPPTIQDQMLQAHVGSVPGSVADMDQKQYDDLQFDDLWQNRKLQAVPRTDQ